MNFAGIRRLLPHLVFDAADAIAGLLGVNDEAADAFFALPEFRRGKHQRNVGVLARGDELLCSVKNVSSVPPFGARPNCTRVRATLRFREAKGAQHLAARHRPQILLLLLWRSVLNERHAADGIMAAHDRRDGPIAGRDFLQRKRIGDIVRAGAVPFRRNRHSHEAELAQFAQRRARKHRLAVPFGRMGRQEALREFARDVPNLLLLLGQQHDSYSAAWRRAVCRAFSNSRATISFCTSVAPS